jgi:hypothetical protein
MITHVGPLPLLTSLIFTVPDMRPPHLSHADLNLFVTEEYNVGKSSNLLLREDESSTKDDMITVAIAGCGVQASDWQNKSTAEMEDAQQCIHMVHRERAVLARTGLRTGMPRTYAWTAKNKGRFSCIETFPG